VKGNIKKKIKTKKKGKYTKKRLKNKKNMTQKQMYNIYILKRERKISNYTKRK